MVERTVKDFQAGQRVVYIPNHAQGDNKHPDCEHGKVSSVNDSCVFVRFDKYVQRFGWDGATSQGCQPYNLEPEGAA